MDYAILTDSGSDIDAASLEKWGVRLTHFTFRKKDEAESYSNEDVSGEEFYREMRAGTVYQTSAINTEEYIEAFEQILSQGTDLLYICFSSGLSASCNFAELAAEDMRERYPERRIEIVDSLCASAGQGLLVRLAARKKQMGLNLGELTEYVRKTRGKIGHWFTVEDLKYLKRGGRISAAAAFAATVLDIKPVMHVDDTGHLVSVSKVRGRNQSLKGIVDKYGQLAEDPKGTYFISHGNCLEDAKALEEAIFRQYGVKAAMITEIGAVIGSHAGPGTLALFFVAKER